MGLQFFEKCFIYLSIFIEHEYALDGYHFGFDLFKSEINCILKNFDFFWSVSVLLSVVKKQNRMEILSRQDDFVFMMSEPVVKDVGDRIDEDIEEHLKESDKRSKNVANSYFLCSCAVGLRNHLTENHYCDRRNYDCQVTWNYLVQEDRQSFERKRV